MTHASSPALHTYDGVALVQHAELYGVHNTPCKAAVDILLPRSCAEVGFRLREVEGVDTTVEMRVLFKLVEVRKREMISVLTREAIAFRVTMMIGQTGRYLETRRAVLPLVIVSLKSPTSA